MKRASPALMILYEGVERSTSAGENHSPVRFKLCQANKQVLEFEASTTSFTAPFGYNTNEISRYSPSRHPNCAQHKQYLFQPQTTTLQHHQYQYSTTSLATMGLFWSKGVGGRRFGANVTADRHGVRRPTFRMRLCGLNCFR